MTATEQERYAPGTHPSLPPPAATTGVIGWMRANLFSSPLNVLLTVLSVGILVYIIPPLIEWAFLDATWLGTTREPCNTAEGADKEGACWTIVNARFAQYMYGFYPADERWRVNLAFLLLFGSIFALLLDGVPYKKWIAVFLFVIYPFVGFALFYGGMFGLEEVETRLWGGLMLTLIIATVGIVTSVPFGILLALGRRSDLPIIRMMCVTFIEFVRAVPLITVLFMSSVMLPLFLPVGVNFDKLMRAVVGFALFAAAYMAEVVRGGLQAIPRGQYEGAKALGLGYWKMMGLIVLPQALRIVIPGMVNTFIGLFKDTSLVLIIGLYDLLGIVQASTHDAQWRGLAKEAYAFAAATYFVFCFAMSRYSMYLERKLHTGHKR
ncbi:MAG: amino acid transporter permease [Rhodospirillales bacterium]|jgi:general L-amino acid transport system permease protein|nr:amino acid transporter permease [Rhodospirillales bacterium]